MIQSISTKLVDIVNPDGSVKTVKIMMTALTESTEPAPTSSISLEQKRVDQETITKMLAETSTSPTPTPTPTQSPSLVQSLLPPWGGIKS